MKSTPASPVVGTFGRLCGHQLRCEKIEPRRVPTRPGKASDQTKFNRVLADPKDDRDRCSRSLGRKRGRKATRRGNNGQATADEVSHERRQAIILAVEPVVLDQHVLALDVAGFVEALSKRGRRTRRGFGRPSVDESNHWYRLLLRLRRNRPHRRCAAKQRDELAALQRCDHSITSSAMAHDSVTVPLHFRSASK